MKMDGDIRIKTDSKYGTLYNQLRGLLVSEAHELFFLCACLGYRKGHHERLAKAEDKFWSSTIQPEEWMRYYAMTLEAHSMDLEAIRDDKKVMSKMEQYANGGMSLLLEGPLKEYVNELDGKINLDLSATKELPKLLLSYIIDENLDQEPPA